MQTTNYSPAAWKQHPLNPAVANEEAAEWIFVVDTLNFSFWHDVPDDAEQQFAVEYNGELHRGYWSLCACINRALDDGIPMLDARFYATASDDQLAHIFRSSTKTPIPMFPARCQVLREAGRVLVERFGGRFANLLAECGHSAVRLVKQVVHEFDSYKDAAEFVGFDDGVPFAFTARFYKRAQILAADIWACFENRGIGRLDDIDALTMFADYRVPQALVYLGALEYSDRLRQQLRARKHFASGDRLEMEIRGCSITAVEHIIAAIRSLQQADASNSGSSDSDTGGSTQQINAVLVDFYLWDFAQEFKSELAHIDIHLTRSVFY
ncbi:hypothetical protein GQ42DRAFT_62820 [Ramicandelaber brevisporus]|nr:hypothetical protein GQ42DRAFT_62820 [Ramicandelaber brevisporus]